MQHYIGRQEKLVKIKKRSHNLTRGTFSNNNDEFRRNMSKNRAFMGIPFKNNIPRNNTSQNNININSPNYISNNIYVGHVPQQIKLSSIDIISKRELLETMIKSDIKRKMSYRMRNKSNYSNGFQPFKNEKNSEHFSSFIYRLIHNYHEYISKFKKIEDCVRESSSGRTMDNDFKENNSFTENNNIPIDNIFMKPPEFDGFEFEDNYSQQEEMIKEVEDYSGISLDELLVFTGDKDLRLYNKQDEIIEIELFSNFFRDYTSLYPNEPPFPENSINFFYNFFCYLFFNRADLDKIIRLESEEVTKSRFFEFKRAIICVFGNFPSGLDRIIGEEMKNFNGNSKTKRKIVNEVIRMTFS